MLANVLGNLGDIVNAVLGAMSGIIVLWPVAVMLGFMLLGMGVAYVKKLAGGKKGKKKSRP